VSNVIFMKHSLEDDSSMTDPRSDCSSRLHLPVAGKSTLSNHEPVLGSLVLDFSPSSDSALAGKSLRASRKDHSPLCLEGNGPFFGIVLRRHER